MGREKREPSSRSRSSRQHDDLGVEHQPPSVRGDADALEIQGRATLARTLKTRAETSGASARSAMPEKISSVQNGTGDAGEVLHQNVVAHIIAVPFGSQLAAPVGGGRRRIRMIRLCTWRRRATWAGIH